MRVSELEREPAVPVERKIDALAEAHGALVKKKVNIDTLPLAQEAARILKECGYTCAISTMRTFITTSLTNSQRADIGLPAKIPRKREEKLRRSSNWGVVPVGGSTRQETRPPSAADEEGGHYLGVLRTFRQEGRAGVTYADIADALAMPKYTRHKVESYLLTAKPDSAITQLFTELSGKRQP